jgi:hypothetical protein
MIERTLERMIEICDKCGHSHKPDGMCCFCYNPPDRLTALQPRITELERQRKDVKLAIDESLKFLAFFDHGVIKAPDFVLDEVPCLRGLLTEVKETLDGGKTDA